MLEKLFESLDEKVFTDELKESLLQKFNESVEEKANLIAKEKIEEKIEELNERAEAHIEFLNEKAEEYIQLKEQEMAENLDKYLDRVIEEFVQDTKEKLDESIKSAKADLLIEAFDSMLVASGVDIAKIVEAKEQSSIEYKLNESIEKYDELVEENIKLREENDKLIKMGIINEFKEDLTLVEAEKFEKLAEMVEFTRDESFIEKLKTIKESVKGSTRLEDIREDVSEFDFDDVKPNKKVNDDIFDISHLI